MNNTSNQTSNLNHRIWHRLAQRDFGGGQNEIAQLIRDCFSNLKDHRSKWAAPNWGNEDFDVRSVTYDAQNIRWRLQNIQGIGEERETRMLFITGGAFTPASIEFLEQTENPWLQKPFDPTALRAAVMDLLEQLPPVHPTIP